MSSSKNRLGLGLVLAATVLRAQDPAAPAPAPSPAAPTPAAPTAAAPAPPANAFTDQQKLEEVGWIVAKQFNLPDFKFSPEERDAIIKGFTTAVGGKEAPYELPKIGPEVNAYMQRRMGEFMAQAKQQSAAKANEYFTKLKENKNVVELPSGLRYEILKPGDGAYPTANDTVTVNYTGTLVDGTVFDSSSRQGHPAEFPLSHVIPGWTEGIQKINKGGKIKLYVPSSLGYGEEGQPGIPPGSTLVFEVELLEFKPTPAPAAAAPAPAPAPGGAAEPPHPGS